MSDQQDHAAIIPAAANRDYLPVEWSAYVYLVAQGSSAELGGIQAGDILLLMVEQTLDETNSFVNCLLAHQPGETRPVEVMRDADRIEVMVTLGEVAAR